MITLKHKVSRLGLALSATALALHFSVANAAPFSSDITGNGSSSFDEGVATGGIGVFGVISGESATTSSYDENSIVTGSNPVTAPLTDINDGVAFVGLGATDDYFATGFNTSISLFNSSSSDSYEVVFRLDYSNMVNADGDNAFSRSLLTVGLDIPFTPEFFFSELSSDTLFGDLDSSGDLTTSGDELIETGEEFFTFILDPTDTLGLKMNLAVEGEVVQPAGPLLNQVGVVQDLGFAESETYASLTLASIEQVRAPIPSTFILVGIGMILLPLQRRVRMLMKS